MLTLKTIGASTLVKALEKNKALEIKMSFRVNKGAETPILQIDVLVASQFLRPVEETIYLKKSKDISETELIKNCISVLSSKMK